MESFELKQRELAKKKLLGLSFAELRRAAFDGFNRIGSLLSDGRNYLLKTERPTFVDFQFASMMSLLLMPEDFGGGAVNPESRLVPKEVGPEVEKLAKEIAATPAGKFALRMYKEHRYDRL